MQVCENRGKCLRLFFWFILIVIESLTGRPDHFAASLKARVQERGGIHRGSTDPSHVRCSGVDDTNALATAIKSNPGKTIVIGKAQTCAVGDLTIPNLRIEQGGFLRPVTPRTVVLSGRFEAGSYQTFINGLAGQGTISFSGNTAIESVNALWWGAKPEGAVDQSKDDTQALQAAFGSGARKIIVPEGHYMIDAVTIQPGQKKAGLNLVSNTEIVMGRQTFLHVKNNSSTSYNLLVGWRVSNVIIRGGNLVGDNVTNKRVPDVNPHGYGLDLQGVTDVSVYQLVAQDMLADGFLVCYDNEPGPHNESERVHLIDCTGYRNFRQGASIVGARNGSIKGGHYFANGGSAPGDGIDLEPNADIHGPGSPSIVSDFVVDGVTANGNDGSGIEVLGQSGNSGVVRVEITNNRCYANGQQGIVYRSASKGTIAGNTTFENRAMGISVYHSTEIVVRDNVSYSNPHSGIIIQNPSGVPTRKITIINNNVHDNGVGITILGAADKPVEDIEAATNTVENNLDTGIWVNFGTNVRLAGNRVTGNSKRRDNESDNILIANSAGSLLSRNIVRRGSGLSNPRYGINISSSTDTVVTDNDLVTAGKTDALRDTSVRSKVFGNKISGTPDAAPPRKPED
jgi:parallel beta-helix repeat protein